MPGMIFRNMKKWLIIKMELGNIGKPLIRYGTYRYFILVFDQWRSFKEGLEFVILAFTWHTGNESSLLLVFLESGGEETVSQGHLHIRLKKANCLLRGDNFVLFTHNRILEPRFIKAYRELDIKLVFVL